MKRMIALTFLTATLISMGSARAHAQATGFKASEGCSLASLKGAWDTEFRQPRGRGLSVWVSAMRTACCPVLGEGAQL